MKLSIILPTYNEREGIADVVQEILDQKIPVPYEIVVVDDNSPDGTAELIRSKFRGPQVKVILRTSERGLRSAIQAGIDGCTGERVCWMDSDGQHPPHLIFDLYRQLDDADVVLASRFMVGKFGEGRLQVDNIFNDKLVFFHGLSSVLLNKWARWVTGTEITDFTSGFVAARRETLEVIQLRGDYGDYLIHFLLDVVHGGLRLKELPYRLRRRVAGDSKTTSSLIGFLKKSENYFKATLSRRRVR